MRIKKKILLPILLICELIFVGSNLKSQEVLKVGAIPDQNPEHLNRLYKTLSSHLSKNLNIEVKYRPVTNYAAAVSAFRTGDLDLVWFGGLTGVQARLQKEGAQVLLQRDIDAEFHSLFIANSKANLPKINNIEDLKLLKGKRFLFGSESSTSGRLMPQHFLEIAGVKFDDFKGGQPGFSGSHDATLALVQSGSYEVGALNEQVWKTNDSKGKINHSKVKVIWKTPSYYDYHWLAQPNLDRRFGKGFTKRLTNVFLRLNKNSPEQKIILDLFNANRFIKTKPENYNAIEIIGRKIGKIND